MPLRLLHQTAMHESLPMKNQAVFPPQAADPASEENAAPDCRCVQGGGTWEAADLLIRNPCPVLAARNGRRAKGFVRQE